MAQARPPLAPLLVILGSTGTGKSELAVELAGRFNGEVVNADAMQMYRGLPIITNKISIQDRRGIPHHLLGNIGLEEETWVVGRFKQEAGKIIKEIRSRGKLPIVVGGTHYYTNALLFGDNLIDDSDKGGGAEPDVILEGEPRGSDPILDGPTDAMLAKLREVDPVMADRWHPNDRRKIRRSLEIFLTRGRKASDIYAEQQGRRGSKGTSTHLSEDPAGWQTLMLWVYSKPDVLNERLNKRVDKMLEAGLVGETTELFEYLNGRLASQEQVDKTKGIWQSIGFKEFEPYLRVMKDTAEPEQLEKARTAAVEDTKTATRRYAKYQIRWITTKTLPLLRDERALGHLYLLDSTNLDKWPENVVEHGIALTTRFLEGREMPIPSAISETARDVLSAAIGASERQDTPCRKVCQVCNKTLLTEELWERHLRGNAHRRAVRHAKRTALVAREAAQEAQETVLNTHRPDPLSQG